MYMYTCAKKTKEVDDKCARTYNSKHADSAKIITECSPLVFDSRRQGFMKALGDIIRWISKQIWFVATA